MHFDWRSFLDWVSIVSAVGTVVAAVLAWRAIAQSSRQARENTELVVSERRRDVQLEALQRLADAIAAPVYNSDMIWHRRRQAVVELAVIDASLPVCRARFEEGPVAERVAALGLPPGTPEDAIDGGTDQSGRATLDRMTAELAGAIRGLAR